MFKEISHFFYDFDGVMTDNTAYISDEGNEFVRINRSDGFAVSQLHRKGYVQIIMSTEKNDVVLKRAEKLKIPCFHGVQDKKEQLELYLEENNCNHNYVAFVGNDLNDLGAMQLAGLSICPADAHTAIKEIADIVLNTNGGNGVIREILDLVMNED